jgi:hypothetical protein
MGFAITWCAVREEAAESFLSRLGLSPTGETEEMPDSPISTAKLDTGWHLLWVNDYAWPFLLPDRLPELSKDQDVLVCRVEEHVMASSSELWSRGEQRWWISHEGENGPKGLETEGTLPDCFAAIRSEMEEAQRAEGGDDADVDMIFEIPLKVAETLVGFKHDEDWPHVIDGRFHVLDGAPPKKGLFSKLFG